MVKPIFIQRGDKNGFRIGWNIEANVGLSSPNRTEDVQLVRLGYRSMAIANLPEVGQELKDACRNLNVRGGCSGREDDELVKIIRLHQRLRGGVQDGHVSIIHTDAAHLPVYQEGSIRATFMLNSIVNNIASVIPHRWPRVDLHEDCPSELALHIIAGCVP